MYTDKHLLTWCQSVGILPFRLIRNILTDKGDEPFLPGKLNSSIALRSLCYRIDGCNLKPVLQALVLAEQVYQDLSGKKIIAGTFNRIQIAKPSDDFEKIIGEDGKERLILKSGSSGAPFAYISLTDVCDGTPITLQFVSLTLNKVIFETDLKLHCANRLATIEVVARLPRIRVPGPGTYAFEIVCEGEIIGSHRIEAVLVQSESKE